MPTKSLKNHQKKLLTYGSWEVFFPTAQNSPELHFRFINSFIHPSRSGRISAVTKSHSSEKLKNTSELPHQRTLLNFSLFVEWANSVFQLYPVGIFQMTTELHIQETQNFSKNMIEF